MFFIDAHCHINSDQLRKDAPGIVRRAAEAGTGRILVAGSDLASSLEAVELAHTCKNEGVFAAVGIHPHDAKTAANALPDELIRLADDPSGRVVAIGEAGLDYYYEHSPRDVQQNVFRMHIEWARQAGKPLVIHVRDAMEDALSILNGMPFDVSVELKLLFHCYAGGLEYLNAMKDLNAWMSLGGPVTWNKSDDLREVAARIPEDRLLCETDAPWLTPKPFRGKLNEPAYVRFVYQTIASVRGVSVEALANTVDANAECLFGWGRLHSIDSGALSGCAESQHHV